MENRKAKIPPASLQRAIDEIVTKKSLSGTSKKNQQQLQDWLETDAYDSVMEIWNDQIAVKIDELASEFFNDETILDVVDVEDSDEITDALRLSFAIERFNEAIEEDSFALSVHAYPVTSTDGQEAFLGFTLETQGQGGPNFEWLGAFTSAEDLHDELDRKNYWLTNEKIEARLNFLLTKWQR